MCELTVLSIQVGKPKTMVERNLLDDAEKHWTSGIFKDPVTGPIFLGSTNLEGDGQDDLKHHGGPDRAVLSFSKANYAQWEVEFGIKIPHGGFGENFTVDGANEEDVCIGDIWSSEQVVLEVSQPRLPCFKLGRRLGQPAIVAKVMERCEGGWYSRVLKEGMVQPGERFRLIQRPFPTWTVKRGFHEYVFGKDNHAALAELHALPALSALWRERLMNLLQIER